MTDKARSDKTGAAAGVRASLSKEPQYDLYDMKQKHGVTTLGLMVNESWDQDAKRNLFMLARYKFVSKMLAGRRHVLKMGFADAFGTRIVQQSVGSITAVDFDPLFIEDVRSRMNPHWHFEAFVHDMLSSLVPGHFDAVYALDVLEHIAPKDERAFLDNALGSLVPSGYLRDALARIATLRVASK